MDRLRDADTTLVVPNPHDIPPPGSIHDQPGFFVDCDLEAGFLGTPFRAYWANMITECIRNAILKAGLVPEYTDWTQLGLAIETIAINVVKNLIPQPTLQSGGNVTGEIRVLDGIFTLNAPEAPESPDVLVQEGGNVTGTISIADGTFTLTAEGGGGSGGGEGPAIPNKIVAIGSGTSIQAAQGGGKQASWDNGEFGVSGVISCGNGYIRSSVYEGQPLAGSGNGLFHATIFGDPTPAHNFYVAASNSVAANPGGVRKFAVDMTGEIFASNASIGAADYAEWFEGAADLPPGVSVVIGDAGLRRFDPERDALDDIIGITRPRDTRAALIGNAAEAHWAGLYLTDDFGAPIWTEAQDEEGRVYPIQTVNPAYDPSRPYTPRSQRPEWSLVGLLGQIPLRDHQPLNPRWRRLRRFADGVTLILVR